MSIVYFSSSSQNTHRFVGKLNCGQAERISIRYNADTQIITKSPYILVTPCFADGSGRGAVPPQVLKFLKNPVNRENLIGVIGGGNKNFGKYFAFASDIISLSLGTPILHKFELMGTPSDVETVTKVLKELNL